MAFYFGACNMCPLEPISSEFFVSLGRHTSTLFAIKSFYVVEECSRKMFVLNLTHRRIGIRPYKTVNKRFNYQMIFHV